MERLNTTLRQRVLRLIREMFFTVQWGRPTPSTLVAAELCSGIQQKRYRWQRVL